MIASPKTLADLEWHKVTGHIEALCTNDRARQQAGALPFLPAEQARQAAVRVAEFAACIAADDPPPRLDVPDPRPFVAHLRTGGDPFPELFLAIASNLRAHAALYRFLENRKDTCPENAREVVDAAPAPPSLFLRLVAAVESVFAPDGSIREDASPALTALHKRIQSLRTHLLTRLEGIAQAHADVLRDLTVTMRNDRYVLAVRADAHRPLPGIVHGTSATGATLFVEPSATVDAGNALVLAKEEIERERRRILADLADELRDSADAIEQACDVVARIEVRIATARFCAKIGAQVPRIVPDPDARWELYGLRHPLLAAEGVDVVPNDLVLSPGGTLLISGPNAGGKSVLLKAVGLCALMAAAGLPVCTDPRSRLALPAAVFTDIGDDQDIAAHLSTFAAHMRHVAAAVAHAGPGTLVLLDEPASGTDPIEGAALARAILDHLNARGAWTAASTHFDALKTYAQHNSAFRNAATGFDPDSHMPTFRLRTGVMGTSSAFDTALRYGIPHQVIDAARAALPEASRHLAEAVAALERETASLRAAAEAAQQREREAQQAKEEWERTRDALLRKERKRLDREIDKAWQELSAVRAALRATKKMLAEPSRRTVARATTAVAQAEKRLRTAAASTEELPGAPATADACTPGTAVYVVSTGKNGTVDAPVRGNQVRVRIGAVTLKTTVDDLRIVAASPRPKTRSRAAHRARAHNPVDGALRTEGNTLDVRGLTGDEACDRIDGFLDEAMRNQGDVVFILTGIGTGALAAKVHAHLRRSPYVADLRFADPEDGGEALTRVVLKD